MWNQVISETRAPQSEKHAAAEFRPDRIEEGGPILYYIAIGQQG
jgi:hypothetical protein